MKKRIIPILLTMVLVITMFTPVSFAASNTKTMTVYSEIIRSGNYVYVNTDHSIYKVNIKTRKSKLLAATAHIGTYSMKLYKGYLYYIDEVDPSYSYTLYRVNIKTKKRTKILNAITTDMQYAIVKSKLYVTYHDTLNDKYVRKVMKLNGKGKKNTKIKAKNTIKNKNSKTKGYKITRDYSHINDEEETGYVITYLKIPKKKIKVCTTDYDLYFGISGD